MDGKGSHDSERPRFDFLSGGGEMGERTRSLDWSRSAVGTIEAWPESLKTAVSICLESRHPMVVWWGRSERTQFYNDAYISFLGNNKHPVYLGRSAHECWREIWPIIEPMLEGVFETGRATWSEDLLFVLNRHLPQEEGYFTFSYSPIRQDDGSVGGIFCACNETTNRVIGERRLRTLRDLNRVQAEAKTVEAACQVAAKILSENPGDVPFALIYLLDSDAHDAHLMAAVGLEAGSPPAPGMIELKDQPEVSPTWPLQAVLESGAAHVVSDLSTKFGSLPGGLWPEPCEAALILPIAAPGQTRPTGFLVSGLSPRRLLDADYRSFLDFIAGHIGTSIASARAYADERRRAEALAEIDRAKTTFFSNVSHEFRTPLTLMLAPLEEAISTDIPERARAHLELVQRSSLRLLKLVNSLLDFSRIEAGRMQVSYEPVDLAALTRDLASTFRSAVERGGLRFVVQCDAIDEPVYVDREMWEKIVLNLLSNAFKFTLAGEIAVRSQRDGAYVVLEISDTGAGIPESELPRLFERFHRVEATHARSQEGTGIGLALVQELVKLHGGTIDVTSELARGTKVRIRLPLGTTHLPRERIKAPADPLPTAARPPAYVEEALRWLPEQDGVSTSRAVGRSGLSLPIAEHRSATDGRILVADDNADMRAYLRDLLSPYYAVEAVTDGEEALAAMRRAPPDLVLSDVMMPRLDGFGLLEALRRDNSLRNIPFILLSARAGEESRIEGFEAGVDDYLVKPFSARELLARVSASLALARVRRDFKEQIAADLAAMTRLRAVGDQCVRAGNELHQCLESILDTAIYLTGADKGNIQLREAGSGALKIIAQRGFARAFLDFFATVQTGDKAACGAAMQSAERVVVENVACSDLFAETPALGVILEAGVRAVQSTPLVSSTGKVLGMISTHFDRPHQPTDRELRLLDLLTRQAADYLERKEADAALRASESRLSTQNKALELADRQKDEFLAMLAHELRNPLGAIRNAVELLSNARAELEPRDEAAIMVAKRQVNQLARLVDDLLDVSRITRGRIELQRRPVDVPKVISQALEAVQALVHERQHKVSVQALSYESLCVNADPARLMQCIVNVLTNAIKYTDPGGEIGVKTYTDASSAIIEISDTGTGISSDLLPRVFDLFVQGDRALDRNQGGLGIGLSVVKRLVEMQGGRVEARSAGLGQGSCFKICLPLIERPTETVTDPEVHQSKPVRVLIVDDNQDAADSLALLLRLKGHEVETIYAAEGVVERARVFEPAIVLLDLGLPGIDGYEVARILRETPELSGLRIIAITGYGRTEDRERTQAAGFNDHLIKPVDLSRLDRLLAGIPNRRDRLVLRRASAR